MTAFPSLAAGVRLTATLLGQMTENVVLKGTVTTRASTATLANDPELAGIVLPVGIHKIRTILFFSQGGTTNTVDAQVFWSFSGTWSGFRTFDGPSTSSTTPSDTTVVDRAASVATTNTYGIGQNFYHKIEEEGVVTVSVTGTFNIQWAQGVSNVQTTSLNVGSFVEWKQVG